MYFSLALVSRNQSPQRLSGGVGSSHAARYVSQNELNINHIVTNLD